MRAHCPTQPNSRDSTAVSVQAHSSTNAVISARLASDKNCIEFPVMIDSGAAANFIDADFVKMHEIPLIPCKSVLAVAVLDGRPLETGHVHYTTGDVLLQNGALHREILPSAQLQP